MAQAEEPRTELNNINTYYRDAAAPIQSVQFLLEVNKQLIFSIPCTHVRTRTYVRTACHADDALGRRWFEHIGKKDDILRDILYFYT